MIFGTFIYGSVLSSYEYKKIMCFGLLIGYSGLAFYQILFVKNIIKDIGVIDEVSLCF
jgi:hypothetical protein